MASEGVLSPPWEFGTNSKDDIHYPPPYVEGTTWLKPLPWDGIHKDENKEIEAEIEIRKTKRYYYDPDAPMEFRNTFDRLKLTGPNEGETNFVAGPVLQVISLRICNEIDPYWNEFKIFGEISITDDRRNVFYIYDREEDDAEAVSSSNNSLSLNPCHFAPVMRGNVKFNLMKDDGGQIFDVESVAEYKTKDDTESQRFNGKYGYYALMVFTIIPYAAIAKVGMHIRDTLPYTGKDETFGVYGKIKAISSNVHGKFKDIEVICFDQSPSAPAVMRHGQNNYIKMYTPVFGVSVLSPLIFDLSLWFSDGTELAVDETDEMDRGYRVIYDIDYFCTNEDFKLNLSVEWFSPRQFFQDEDLCEYARVEWSRRNFQQIDQPTDLPFVDDKYLMKSLNFLPACQIDRPPEAGHRLVEVFSILVESDISSSPPLALCGSIVLRHRDETLYIFSRNKTVPDKLSSNEQGFRKCVSLAWSDKSWVVEKDFFMHLKLKDDKANEVCRGYLGWFPGYDPLRHDKRMCEVILGKDGYFAAVHYSIFTNGLRAKVTIQCYNKFANDSNCISVYGSVFAEYSNYNYHSTYEKEYYRSIIFKRSAEDSVFVKNRSELPLSKSRVCAPSNCKVLIVDVDLFVEVNHFGLASAPVKFRQGCGHVYGRIPFKAKTNVVCEILENESGNGWGCEGCCIRVSVDWF